MEQDSKNLDEAEKELADIKRELEEVKVGQWTGAKNKEVESGKNMKNNKTLPSGDMFQQRVTGVSIAMRFSQAFFSLVLLVFYPMSFLFLFGVFFVYLILSAFIVRQKNSETFVQAARRANYDFNQNKKKNFSSFSFFLLVVSLYYCFSIAPRSRH